MSDNAAQNQGAEATSLQVWLSPQASVFFFKCCVEKGLPHLELVKYVWTCWSSMFDLLKRAFMLKVVSPCFYCPLHFSSVFRVLQNSYSLPMIVPRSPTYSRSAMLTLGNHPLSGSNWTYSIKFSRYCQLMIMLDHFLTLSMQHPALAQQEFSSERVPTASHVFLTIEFLLTSLEAAEKDARFAPIRNAITAGISNLTKWYWRFDVCDMYAVSSGMLNQMAQVAIDWSIWQSWTQMSS